MTLAELVLIRRGEELSKDSALLSEMPLAEGRDDCYPVLRGGVDVRPYATPAGRCWIASQEVKKPLERYLAPKLLVVKSTGELQATLDLQSHVVLQTLYTLNLRAERVVQEDALDELYFLLALLNSRLLRAYVHMLHTAYKWVQPQIEQRVLAHLPIPTIVSPERASIIARAKVLLRACSELPPGVELKEQKLYEEQEHAICALYDAALSGEHMQNPLLQSVTKESENGRNESGTSDSCAGGKAGTGWA